MLAAGIALPLLVEITHLPAFARAKFFLFSFCCFPSRLPFPLQGVSTRHSLVKTGMDCKQGSFFEHKRNAAPRFVFRILLFALAFTALHFLYVLHGGSSCSQANSSCFNGQIYHEFIHLSSVFQPVVQSSDNKIQAYRESSHLYLRKALNSNVMKLWTSRDWRSKVDLFSLLFTDFMEAGILHSGDKGLCIGAGAGHEVLALQEIGVKSVGMNIRSYPPIVVEGNKQRIPFSENVFDFVFCNSFDLVMLYRTVSVEMERTLKPGGYVIIPVSGEKLKGNFGIDTLYSAHMFTNLFKDSDVAHIKKVHALNLDHAIVIRKRLQNKSYGITDKCAINEEKGKIIREAEPLIVEEPLKPWITLKQNAAKIKYLPSIIDISDNQHYFYVDVGARSYHSSIGSWFVKKYPKQSQDFSIYAVEADDSFAANYVKRKNVKFLPYAAWLKNESLVFGANPENRAAEGEIGMGRIQSRASLNSRIVTGRQFKTVQGFDFGEWLINTVTADDYVVMKMDVEGAEFDLLPRMMETGAICLVDELFLECHYNRWQRSSPLRSTKYGRTYKECLSLFESLRKNGVLVHQWW